LEVRVALLDELLTSPDHPSQDLVMDLESKKLRELKDKIELEGLKGGYNFIEKQSHPKLWKILAQVCLIYINVNVFHSYIFILSQTSLERVDFDMAEKAFARFGDYFGIQFVKQLRTMPDKMKVKALT
jgi:WD repeat-containing protein 35